MQTNEILEHYRKQIKRNNGILNLDSIPMENFEKNYRYNTTIFIYKGKKYFIKSNSKFFDDDYCCLVKGGYKPIKLKINSAEILSSQIYAKAGLIVPTYFLSTLNGKKYILSDDISTPLSEYASDFHAYIAHIRRIEGYEISTAISKNESQQGFDIKKYFSKLALKDLIIAQACDLCIQNTDSHNGNQIVFTDGTTYANRFGFFDFEASSIPYFLSLRGVETDNKYFPKIGNSSKFKTKQEIIDEFHENEVVNGIIPHQEVGEIIGNIDVPKIADDIHETIGYKIDPHYVDFITKSCNDVAEELVR